MWILGRIRSDEENILFEVRLYDVQFSCKNDRVKDIPTFMKQELNVFGWYVAKMYFLQNLCETSVEMKMEIFEDVTVDTSALQRYI